ncbi:MAG: antitoxin, partial [Clostridiaceae bacterium]|nr:antitoxin [Clostridiaceae bacterium]
ALAESYAKIHSYSLAEAFKKALFEKIEEEYDVAVYHAAYKEYEESGKKSRPIEELWKELEI